MPTKRRRLTRTLIGEVSPNVLFVLEHGYAPDKEDEVEDGNWLLSFELWGECIGPHDASQLREFWARVREPFLADWIQHHPGTRPFAWWRLDAPRWAHPGLAEWNVGQSAAPRQQVGGSGRPDWEANPNGCMQRIPWGISRFVDVDPNDPPRVEAQATYLERHGLLSDDERSRLTPEDLEPEVVKG